MNTPPPFALHNPALLPPETLLAEFTARRPLLEELLRIVRQNQPGQPPQHVLLLGARGMGKSTALWAVAHRVRRDSGLARQWQPVVFDEESRRVGDLTDFWLEALRQWEYATATRSDRVDCLLDSDNSGLEERAREAFLSAVDKSGRRALLLIDNFNELLEAIHDSAPLHRLRAFLMEDSRVTIIGSATRYFDEITALDRPFFDFFRVFDLHPLTLEEMKACLLALGKTRRDPSVDMVLEERSGTVRALHLLTGGNPRLIKAFYRILAEGLSGSLRADLERLLDEITPYFKASLDALPGQQQRILDALALAWDPVEVRELARLTRLPSNQVSAQLRALAKSGLIAEAGPPKRKTYLLADRFSNLYYLLRHGRVARDRFDWFLALTRLVFPDKENEILAESSDRATDGAGMELHDADNLTMSATRSMSDERQEAETAQREDWRAVLPSLCAKCSAHPMDEETFYLALNGLIKLAEFSGTEEALSIIQGLPAPAPFETLAAAFHAHFDLDYLLRLAPERREVAIELLKRLPGAKKQEMLPKPRRGRRVGKVPSEI